MCLIACLFPRLLRPLEGSQLQRCPSHISAVAMADNVPRFMQSTKASQEKLSDAATNKKTKIPSMSPATA